MNSLRRFLLTLLIAAGSLVLSGRADDLDALAGKWTVKKTVDGQSVSQVIEVAKGRFKFRMLDSGGDVRLYAEGDLKAEKLGPFSVLKFTNIKAGRSADDSLQSVDDDRTSIYQLSGDTLTLASNLDKDRDRGPSLDKYTKGN